jgi:hypothetical protein
MVGCMSNHSDVKYLIILNNNYHSFNIVISQRPDVSSQHQGKSLNTIKPRQGKSENSKSGRFLRLQ